MTRARTSPDMVAMSAAMRRPGMDTRVWLSLATVLDIGFDATEGIFVDVALEPSGDRETCRMGTPYAGNLFGAYFPLEVDDEVLVAVPSGNTGDGPFIVCRTWNRADPPPAEAGVNGEPAPDPFIKVKAGQSFTIFVDNGGLVNLGGTGGQPVGLGRDIETYLKNLVDQQLSLHTHSGVTTGTGVSGPPSMPFTSPPNLQATKANVL